MSYPDALETLVAPVASNGDTLLSVPHDQQHSNANRLILELEKKLGVGAFLPTSGLFLVGDTVAGSSKWRAAVKADVGLSNVDNTSDTTKLATTLAAVYPVGCLYVETTGTNPASTFGFGTWAAFGAGRVPVGYSAGDPDFGSGGATGGEKTHTLTSTEMPAHTHGITAQPTNLVTTNPGASNRADGAATGSNMNGTPVNTTGTTDSTGSGGSHNNLQPFIVVYMWKRTA